MTVIVDAVAGRTAVLIAGACALVLFAAFWLAPPRAAVGGNPAPGAVAHADPD